MSALVALTLALAPFDYPPAAEDRLSDEDRAEMVALITEREERERAELQARTGKSGRRSRTGATAAPIPCLTPEEKVECLEDDNTADKRIVCDLADPAGKWHRLAVSATAQRNYVSLKDRGAVMTLPQEAVVDSDPDGLLAGLNPGRSNDYLFRFGDGSSEAVAKLSAARVKPTWSTASLIRGEGDAARYYTGFCEAEIFPRGPLSMAEVREHGL
ncbi:MAG: hypothetical protein R3E02_05500 [Blastomonas sp.]